jgi:ssRNA-specific RNase YbeY (16S rRNA maturation enzyme)
MNSLEVLGAVIIPESEQEKIAELNFLKKILITVINLCKIVYSNTMKRYNKRYRGLAETTDILSFVTAELPFARVILLLQKMVSPISRYAFAILLLT